MILRSTVQTCVFAVPTKASKVGDTYAWESEPELAATILLLALVALCVCPDWRSIQDERGPLGTYFIANQTINRFRLHPLRISGPAGMGDPDTARFQYFASGGWFLQGTFESPE